MQLMEKFWTSLVLWWPKEGLREALGWPLDAEKARYQGWEVIELIYTWETPVLERGKWYLSLIYSAAENLQRTERPMVSTSWTWLLELRDQEKTGCKSYKEHGMLSCDKVSGLGGQTPAGNNSSSMKATLRRRPLRWGLKGKERGQVRGKEPFRQRKGTRESSESGRGMENSSRVDGT